jgi:VIT1/CCC1 family predicted Fe2+/Mn2+ transporter
MFVSYILTGGLVLLPYLVSDTSHALPQSIVLSLGLLFLLGVVSATVSRLPVLRRAIRMMFVGGLAILLGIAVGRFMP